MSSKYESVRNMYIDPLETGTRTPKYAKDAQAERLIGAVNTLLQRAELPARGDDVDTASLPLIYLVGLPRSGTTLFSQVVSRYFRVGYIDNLIARFWMRPRVGIALSRAVLGSDSGRGIRLDSEFGNSPDAAGPHEFGYFWRYWLRLDESNTHSVDAQQLTRVDRDGLRATLEDEILAPFALPAVFKNVGCGFCASFLTELHPRSLFVFIRRNPIEVGRSILDARIKRYGSYADWWSLKPSNFADIAKLPDPGVQVANQIAGCLRDFERGLSEPNVRLLVVDYEQLCSAPSEVLASISRAVGELGYDLAPAGEPPAAFSKSSGKLLPKELEQTLSATLADLLGGARRSALAG